MKFLTALYFSNTQYLNQFFNVLNGSNHTTIRGNLNQTKNNLIQVGNYCTYKIFQSGAESVVVAFLSLLLTFFVFSSLVFRFSFCFLL